MIKNGTKYPMHLILQYLGAGDKRDAELFGKLTLLREDGKYYDTLVVNDKK